MDGEGNLALRETITVGFDTHVVKASPDGRTVVFSTDKTYLTSSTLTVVNIKPDGSLRPPVYLTNPHWGALYNSVVFHTSLPFFYVGANLAADIVHYNSNLGLAELTGQIHVSEQVPLVGYSPYANSLITNRHKYEDPIWRMEAVSLSADGLSGQERPFLNFPWAFSIPYGTVSPNGRWAVVTGYGGGTAPSEDYNELALVRVGGDGTLSLAQQIDLTKREAAGLAAYTCFSPDGRRLYMLSYQGEQVLLSYTLDEDKGELTQRDAISWTQMPQAYDSTLSLTISPDGRFAAFRSINDQQIGHNWINVVRLYEDGTMQYLLDKRIDVPQYLGDLAFAPYPKQNAANPQWAIYE